MPPPRASTHKRTYCRQQRPPPPPFCLPSFSLTNLFLFLCRILSEPKNPALYTNRAMTRLKMGTWDSVVADCSTCIELAPANMKAHYYLAQAQAGLGDFDTGLKSALRAYELCRETNDKSMGTVAGVVLRCKKERWEARERRRARQGQELEADLARLLARERDDMIGAEPDETEKRAIAEDAEAKASMLRQVFERARSQDHKKREVPDWAIDDIGFGIMVDPVMVRPLPQSQALETPIPLLFVADSITAHRLRRANHTSGPPSWSTSAASPPTP